MKVGKSDLTHGPLGKQIFWFSVPLMLSNLLQILFNMADVAVVGRFAGSIALGAVGSTTTLVTLFTGALIGMSGGINVLAALHFGAKNPKLLSATVHSSAILSALAGILLMAVGILTVRPVLELLHTKEELIDGAVLYLKIYYLGMPALGVYNFGNAVFSAVGDTKRPLYYLTAAGIINIVLNLFFVIVCGMDVEGVAIASIISQYVSAFLVTAALFRTDDIYGLRRSELRLDPGRTKAVLAIGIPAAMQNIIFALANLFIQMGVNSFDAIMVAGNAAATNADTLIYNVVCAFYTACGSFVGQNYGARNMERIRKSYRLSILYGMAVCAIMGGGLILAGHPFLYLFTDDPAVVDAGMKRLVIMCGTYFVSPLMDCPIAAARGMGKSLVPTVMVILGSCVFRVIWIYTIFAYFQTVASLYLLYFFSWAITAAAEMWYFHRVYRSALRTMD